MKNKRYNFNTKLNEEEYEILRRLKNEYAINISGAFKLFLRKYLNDLQIKEKGNEKG